ncbi:hypothetical protein OA177_01155 [Candidatus Pelagibacter sp.]|nr:hypothetical protein [Candidatus Pelagibacter sp.]
MKLENCGSTLSCILKCIRFAITMINKKIFFGLFVISLLTNCSSPTAMLGPVYTLSSTGSGLQAGVNYGSNQLITMYTGNTPIENLKKISVDQKKDEINVQKKTLESEDFYFLVKKRIEITNKIINKANQ